MKKTWKKLTAMLLSVLMVASMLTAISFTASAAETEGPKANKILTDNGDGTYQLSLDIAGATDVKYTGVNIVLVQDLSYSMRESAGSGSYKETTSDGRNLFGKVNGEYVSLNYDRSWNVQTRQYDYTYYYISGGRRVTYTGTRYQWVEGGNRLEVSKSALNVISESLLANNTAENPNAVQIALVSFGNEATVNVQPTTSLNTIKSGINGLNFSTYTNWEEGLKKAKSVNFGDKEKVYVIFVSDGDPTWSTNNHPTSRVQTEDNYNARYNDAKDDAKAIVDAGMGFYSVSIYGEGAVRMQSLANYAYGGTAPAGHYFNATDSAAIYDALAAIQKDIEAETQGIGQAVITDGTTEHVVTSDGIADLMKVDTNSFKYTINGTPWSDAPAAKYENGEVTWDLSSLGLLNNASTYTVSFTVYPTQYTEDLVAQLKNGTVSYSSLDENIKKYLSEDGKLKTNTEATYSYVDTKVSDKTQTREYKNPDPISVDSSAMSVQKAWENLVDQKEGQDVTLTVTSDGAEFGTLELKKANGYKGSLYIAPGILQIKDGGLVVLEPGHDYAITESSEVAADWILDAAVLHPMLVNGKMTSLEKLDAAPEGMSGDYYNDGSTDYFKLGDSYYKAAGSSANLLATNYRKSNLILTKELDGYAPEGKEFTFCFKMTDPDGKDVVFSAVNADGSMADITDKISGDVVPESGNTGYYFAKSGSEIYVSIPAGVQLVFEGLSTGTEYVIEESAQPAGFSFVKTETSRTGEQVVAGESEVVEGTIEIQNTSYSVKYIDKYAAAGSVALTATKVLEGRDWLAGESFEFTLADEKELADAKTVTAASPVAAFDTISYTEADLANSPFTYTIKETSELPGGMKSSGNLTVNVTLTDNGDGTITATPQYSNNGIIKNTYTAEPTTATLSVKKTINTGVSGVDGSFEFKLYEGEEVLDANLVDTASVTTSGGEGTADFKALSFDAAGTYPYVIVETKGSTPGFSYNENTFKVNIVVTDNNKGQLEAEVQYGTDDSYVDVVNDFTEESIGVTLNLTKVINDLSESAQDGTFTFYLKETSEGDPIQTKQITTEGLTGSVSFDELVFEAAGTYNYIITEEGGDVEGFTYDTKEYPVVIIVTDNVEEAKLEAGVTIDGKDTLSLTVTNDYKAASTDAYIQVTKVVDDTSGSAYETTFEFTLSDGAEYNDVKSITGEGLVEFDKITFEKAGSYNYTITETKGSAAGYTYDTTSYPVLVTVTDESGKLVASVTYGEGESASTSLSVTNKYEPTKATAQLGVLKKVDDQSKSAPTGTEFTFVVEDAEGSQVRTATSVAGFVDFDEFEYTEVGTYTYKISETPGGVPGYTYSQEVIEASVEVTDNKGILSAQVTYKDENNTITNTYKADPTQVQISGTKELSGMNEGVTPVDFNFLLVDVNGETIQTTSTKGSGTLSFEDIPVSEAGTYTYYIKEVNDGAEGYTYTDVVYEVVVTVTDKDGKLETSTKISKVGEEGTVSGVVFENSYSAEATDPVIITAVKELIGRELKEDEFLFTLLLGGETYTTGTNDADGNITFELVFEAPGIYSFVISELNEELPGVTYDETDYPITVTVTDNGKGKLVAEVDKDQEAAAVFTNVYEPAPSEPVDITVSKELEGRELKEGEFLFDLMLDEDIVATAKNDADGNITFTGLTYEEEGIYNYVIVEELGSVKGITYDQTKFPVTVTVTDNKEGKLVAEVDEDQMAAAVFNNSYKAENVKLTVEATKKLTGRTLKEGEFEFALYNAGNEVARGKNDANGVIKFSELVFEKAGTYEFVAKEIKGSAENVKYDTKEFTFKVVVTDDLEGTLKAELEAEDIIFTNVYNEPVGPATGDTNNMTPWAVGLALSVVVVFGLIAVVRRRERF